MKRALMTACAVIGLCGLVFTCGCGGSDDSSGGGDSTGIVGNWSLVGGSGNVILHVNSDGTYSVDGTGTTAKSGIWSVNGNQLTTTATGGQPGVETYSVSSSTLTITGTANGTAYTRVYNRIGTSSIVGSWNLVSISGGGQTLSPAQFGDTAVFTFNADGTCSSTSGKKGTQTGTWSVSGNLLTAGAYVSAPYTVTGNTLTIDTYFTFKVVNGQTVIDEDSTPVVQTFTRI